MQEQEELLCKERKEREHIIASYRRKAEEHKAQTEKVDRKVTTFTHRSYLSKGLKVSAITFSGCSVLQHGKYKVK